MAYGVFYAVILLVAIIFFATDINVASYEALVNPSHDSGAELRATKNNIFLRNLKMLLVAAGIMICLWVVHEQLAYVVGLTEEQNAVLIFVAFFLIFVRKIVTILVPQWFFYLCHLNPVIKQKVQVFIADEGNNLYRAPTIFFHGVVLGVMIILALIATTWKSLSLSRVHVLTHKLYMLGQYLISISGAGKLLVWALIALAFCGASVLLTSVWIGQTLNRDEYGNVKNSKKFYESFKLVTLIKVTLVSLIALKAYTWFFIMKQYVFEDILFNVGIAVIIIVVLVIQEIAVKSSNKGDPGEEIQ